MSEIGTDKPGLAPEDFEKMGEWAENGVGSAAQKGATRNITREEPEHEPEPPGRTTGDRGSITVTRCRDWRDRVVAGESPTKIAEEAGLSIGTVSYHVNDHCSHARSHPMDGRRCAVVRCMAHEGTSYCEIARVFPAFGTRSTIAKHGRGDCSHEIDTPPVAPRQ